jgi:hypothetical protein
VESTVVHDDRAALPDQTEELDHAAAALEGDGGEPGAQDRPARVVRALDDAPAAVVVRDRRRKRTLVLESAQLLADFGIDDPLKVVRDRRIAGSPDRRIAGSPDRRIAGSPDRRIARRPRDAARE